MISLDKCSGSWNSVDDLSSVKWTVLGHPRPKLNKIIFSTKPSGPL